MNNNEAHTQLVDDAVVELNKDSDVRAFKMNVGAGLTFGGRPMRFGFAGLPDIIGFRRPFARFFALDAKTGTGRLSTQQKKFVNVVLSFGGIAGEFRSVEEAVRMVRGH